MGHVTKTDDRLHPGHLLGIFFISAASLLLEVCLSRLLAVSLWYHFAFMIISGGLLGFGASAIVVSLWSRLREAPLDRVLPAISAVMGIAVVGCFALSQVIPLQPFSVSESSAQVFYFAVVYLLLTFPFFLAGLVVSLMLARLVHSVTMLYALDLAGAGVGAVLALGLLSWFGGPSTLVLAAALSAAAAAALAWTKGWSVRAAGVALGILFVVLAMSADQWLPFNIDQHKILNRALENNLERGRGEIITRWSPIGRVDVINTPQGEPRILIDGGVAATRVPVITSAVESWQPPPEGMASVMIVAPESPSVLLIGSGGGYEVASALALGARRIQAVEMNEAIVDLVLNELDPATGGLFHDPRVELITDEGRSFVRRSRTERVDVIGCVHTISNAAWASGAVSLAENYTLTVEALDDFLGHLTDGGALWLTRPEAQLPRLVATVRTALVERGAEAPADHIIAYRQPARGHSFLGGLIVTKQPLTAHQVEAAVEQLRRDRLQPLVVPGQEPIGRDARAYQVALDPGSRLTFTRELGELRPCTDERPYFNQRRPWTDLAFADLRAVFGSGQRGRMAMEDAPVAEVAVLIVLAWAFLFSFILIVVPLLLWRRLRPKNGRPEPSAVRFVPYFIALGLGYITVEICLIQRLGLFVGRPEYALAVVLCAMLVSSGAGSMVATRWAGQPRRASRLALGVVVALIVVHAALGPAMTNALLGLGFVSRMFMASLLVAPLGFAMGMPMPLGLRAAPQSSPHLLAWVFGLNCAASVVGSSLCVILSSTLSFTWTLLVTAAVYGVAALSTFSWKSIQS